MKYCNKTLRYGKIRRIVYQEGLVIASVFDPKNKKVEKSVKSLLISSFNPEFPLFYPSLH